MTYRRVFRATISGVAWLALALAPSTARAQCSQTRNTSYPPGYYYIFSSDSLWTSGTKGVFNDAIAVWENAIANAPNSPGGDAFIETTNSSWASVVVAFDWNLVNTTTWGYYAVSSGNIFLNPDIFGHSVGFSTAVALHEIGHSIGFADVGSSCDSIMRGTMSPSAYPWFSSTDYGNVSSAYNTGWCGDVETCSPIIVDLGFRGVHLTAPAVWFDITGTGRQDLLAWTPPGTADAFLWLDRNGDGAVNDGRELFGNVTPLSWTIAGPRARHGFEALAYFDHPSQGGNGDGVIDQTDAVFGSLRLWSDRDQNGESGDDELQTLDRAGVTAFDLAFRLTRRQDQFGNEFRYRSYAWVRDGPGILRREVWDVFFVLASR